MKKILCADDEPFNLVILTEYLDSHYQVDTVTNGTDCIVFLEKQMPDLVILDHLMPGIDGLEACKIIKSNETTKHVPVIISSGNASPQDIENARSAGANDFLAKPFDEDTIIDIIKSNLS